MRLQRGWWIAVVVALAGCGGSEEPTGSTSGADPSAAVPAGAVVYFEAVVRPEGEQGDNVNALLDRFLGDRELSDLLDEELSEDDLSYENDIKPWLGSRAGLGVT